MIKRPRYAPEHSQVRVHKAEHFTVTPIDDINAWKAERAKIEAEYHKAKMERFLATRERAMAIVRGEKQVELLSTIDKAEIDYVKSRENAKKPAAITWDQIQAKKSEWDVKNEARRAVGEKSFLFHPAEETTNSEPLPSLFKRLSTLVTTFFKSAFPE